MWPMTHLPTYHLSALVHSASAVVSSRTYNCFLPKALNSVIMAMFVEMMTRVKVAVYLLHVRNS